MPLPHHKDVVIINMRFNYLQAKKERGYVEHGYHPVFNKFVEFILKRKVNHLVGDFNGAVNAVEKELLKRGKIIAYRDPDQREGPIAIFQLEAKAPYKQITAKIWQRPDGSSHYPLTRSFGKRGRGIEAEQRRECERRRIDSCQARGTTKQETSKSREP